jgi:hypothetical protein
VNPVADRGGFHPGRPGLVNPFGEEGGKSSTWESHKNHITGKISTFTTLVETNQARRTGNSPVGETSGSSVGNPSFLGSWVRIHPESRSWTRWSPTKHPGLKNYSRVDPRRSPLGKLLPFPKELCYSNYVKKSGETPVLNSFEPKGGPVGAPFEGRS